MQIMHTTDITLTINEQTHTLAVKPNDTLLEVVRDYLDLTGSKEGCGEGVCGSCTVLLDGHPVRACLTLALEADGSDVTTVEGLADGDTLSVLQQSFIDHGAVQCGFCTPGMLMSARALLNDNPSPDREAVRKSLSGNICRCTGYAKIVDAVEHAARPESGCPDCHNGETGGDHD
ncbi:MAG TPA: (2Fe-2S)-binding protein [Desulfotignum sp.]|nr:(2Fe-2S)-binding protein [Desulfotignum sp.]